MKVTSVEIHQPNSSEVITLSYQDPKRLNPYNVKAIIGLDAEEIVARYYGVSASTGQKFYTLSLEKRTPIVRIEFNPRYELGESPSSLRDALYKYISSSRTGLVQLRFLNGEDVVAAISGFVAKFEAPHFTKTPEIQITINAVEPMLKALEPTIVDISALDPAATNLQDELSTAPHGFKFELAFTANPASLSISDPLDPTWSFGVVPAGGFLTGDILHFSSESNEKYLYIERGIEEIHLADVITPGSIWPIMFPGDNNFALTNPTSLDWNAISYYPTYWGV